MYLGVLFFLINYDLLYMELWPIACGNTTIKLSRLPHNCILLTFAITTLRRMTFSLLPAPHLDSHHLITL